MENKVISFNEIRNILNISAPTLRKIIETDMTFKAFRVGNKYGIMQKDLNSWIKKQQDKK